MKLDQNVLFAFRKDPTKGTLEVEYIYMYIKIYDHMAPLNEP